MFDKIKAGFARATAALRRLAGITNDTRQKVETFTVAAEKLRRPRRRGPVKRQLYRSAFTKKGPGVVGNIRLALRAMIPAERLLCRAKGWDRGMVSADGSMR